MGSKHSWLRTITFFSKAGQVRRYCFLSHGSSRVCHLLAVPQAGGSSVGTESGPRVSGMAGASSLRPMCR